jgi:hypothetical protein
MGSVGWQERAEGGSRSSTVAWDLLAVKLDEGE